MTKILLATHNKNKVKEFQKLLPGYELISLHALGDGKDFEETGKSFLENAFLKAFYYNQKHDIPTIADDSGLEVLALNMRPGIHSKRYSGGGDKANNILLLEELKDKETRAAQFKTVLCLCVKNKKEYFFEGILTGEIAQYERGSEGFGYDPLFIPKGETKTLAELGNDYKNKISHRAIAAKKLKRFLDENFNNE